MDKKEAWVSFASAALNSVMSTPMDHNDQREFESGGAEAVQNYRAKGAAEWADAMLAEYEKRFNQVRMEEEE